jgi:chemotaxis response regulator CheB
MKGSKIRTLIVDDEPLARRNLRVLLEKDPQIEILDECRNGREAVKAINTLSPDLICLDMASTCSSVQVRSTSRRSSSSRLSISMR